MVALQECKRVADLITNVALTHHVCLAVRLKDGKSGKLVATEATHIWNLLRLLRVLLGCCAGTTGMVQTIVFFTLLPGFKNFLALVAENPKHHTF